MAAPRESLNFAHKKASFAKSVGSFVPGLTRKSFEKYGFSTAALLTDWAAIAGRELASFTLPERLKWPRNVDAYETTETDRRGRPGATLVLRVDGPRAIEVQYQAQQIIERINAHFGYRAVSTIRFVQAPLPHPAAISGTRAATPAKTTDPATRPSYRGQSATALAGNSTGEPERAAAGTPRPSHAGTDQPSPSGAATSPDHALLAALDRLHDNITRSAR